MGSSTTGTFRWAASSRMALSRYPAADRWENPARYRSSSAVSDRLPPPKEGA